MKLSRWQCVSPVHVVVLTAVGGLALAAMYSRRGDPTASGVVPHAEPTLPVERKEPLRIPLYRRQLLTVTRDQYAWLAGLMEPSISDVMSVSYCLHVLRVHGLDRKFDSLMMPDGHAIVRVLTNEKDGEFYFGKSPLIRTRYGVRFRTASQFIQRRDKAIEAHRDQCLAAFAELGVPLAHPVSVATTEASVEALLNDSIANFHLAQDELPWTAIAYTLYLPPRKRWTTRFGETFTFDELARELLQRPLFDGSCGGTHYLHGLAVLFRADEATRLLSSSLRDELRSRLDAYVRTIGLAQSSNGSWCADWWHSLVDASTMRGRSPANTTGERLLVTSHLAEFLLYLPPEMVDDTLLRRAGALLASGVLVAVMHLSSSVKGDHPPQVCGLNSLYIYLALHSCPVEFEYLANELPIGARGISLLALRNAATRCGVPSSVVRCSSPGELPALPVVAHLRPVSRMKTAAGGHYVVILARSVDSVTVIDGTTGIKIDMTHADFRRVWTGYVLKRRAGHPDFPTGLVTLLVCLGFPWVAYHLRYRMRRFTGMVALGGVIILSAQNGVAGTESPSSLSPCMSTGWRSPAHDAINVAYILLRTHGVAVDYSELHYELSRSGPCSLRKVRDAMRRRGLPAVVSIAGPDSLPRAKLPVAVLLDSSIAQGSSFALLATASGDVCLIDGGQVVWRRLTSDEFRRQWSGHVLRVEEEATMSLESVVILCAGCCYGGIVVYRLIRYH